MSEEKKRMSTYWICDDCVKSKHPDWKTAYPFGGNTMIMGLCGHCERTEETFLTPTCDYKRKGHTTLWD